MSRERLLFIPVFVLIALLSVGCAVSFTVSHKPDVDARLKGRRIALVTVLTTREVKTADPTGNILGLVKKATSKYSGSIDSRYILRHTMPVVDHWLAHNRYFHLVPRRVVERNAAYRHMAQDKPSHSIFTGSLYMVPKGYRYFEGKDKLARLAREMHVDGVAYLEIRHIANMDVVAAPGVGKRRAETVIVLYIVDRQGNTLLQFTDTAESKKGYVELSGSTDMKRLIPYFVESTRIAMNDLDKTLAAKM